jgi:hypothetical protein
MTKLTVHPLAEMYPDIAGPESSELRKSLKEQGQIVPIVCLGDQILDGRQRYRELTALKIKPRIEQYRGKSDPASINAFIDGCNERRRHMNSSQRSWLAAKRLKWVQEQGEGANLRLADVAEQMDVSERSVQMAGKVIANGTPQLAKAVEQGAITVSDASNVVDLPKAEQNAALKKVERGEAKTVTSAAVEFDPVKLDAKKRKQGRQRQKPQDRKEALTVLSRLVRILDKMGITPDVEGQLKTILAAIKS